MDAFDSSKYIEKNELQNSVKSRYLRRFESTGTNSVLRSDQRWISKMKYPMLWNGASGTKDSSVGFNYLKANNNLLDQQNQITNFN